MKTFVLAALGVGVALAGSAAQATPLPLPASFFIDATSPVGATFTFINVSSSDTLAFTVSGTPTLQSLPTGYGVNAAGVVTLAGTTGVGGSSTDPISGFTYGALILTLNGTTAVQAFATDGGNGLGLANPPTTLSLSRSLQDIFGLAPGQLAAATINFKLDDTLYTDNAGRFTVTAATGAVPEPASWALAIVGFGATGAAWRRRRRTRARISVA